MPVATSDQQVLDPPPGLSNEDSVYYYVLLKFFPPFDQLLQQNQNHNITVEDTKSQATTLHDNDKGKMFAMLENPRLSSESLTFYPEVHKYWEKVHNNDLRKLLMRCFQKAFAGQGDEDTILTLIQNVPYENCMFCLIFHRCKGQYLSVWNKFFQGWTSVPAELFKYTLTLLYNCGESYLGGVKGN
ncbi:hypothetical protein PILCRDRAFT_6737 [Piloderma croceum F 1598]|uniref:Uncharacterized protein n=1 Tax=Piloderma croceum (strain F 1598) TaxID=765440 RepID=A0A0C3FHI6_PILCF|nr:hypothetical protein PILCRDRAFT_6737 [Piloderma croceum F 1598]